jgi:aconitate decarboxylase
MAPLDPEGPTGQLSTWIADLKLESVPQDVLARTKHLLLDGLACAIVGAHLPWSKTAVEAVLDMEPEGTASIFGWDKVFHSLCDMIEPAKNCDRKSLQFRQRY